MYLLLLSSAPLDLDFLASKKTGRSRARNVRPRMSCSVPAGVFDPTEETFPFRVLCTDLTDFKERARQRAGLSKDLEPEAWILIQTP